MLKNELHLLLADMSYERRSPSPLAAPMAIAGLATYVRQQMGRRVRIRIVKSVNAFLEAIQSNKFQVAGFSHYIWNANLSLAMASVLKEVNPNCVIVFGGPHLPIHPETQEAYLRKLNDVDFFIEKEGESSLVDLLQTLEKNDFNVEKVKEVPIGSIRTIYKGEFISWPLAPRIRDLDEIPSPYMEGMLDEFIRDGFSPMVENNRGCPFSCAFCGEGDQYHSRVARHSTERLITEYEYCARLMKSLPFHPFPNTLYFSDSNTGMYAQDQELCEALGGIQKTYGWPKQIFTSTGKNAKERIINCVELLNGAMTLTASVQSTDPEVLKIIKRDNISLDVIKDSSKASGSRSYSEIILGLPGDTYEKHLKSIQDMIELRIDELAIIQLMVLPDTPMYALDYRKTHQLDVRHRLLVKGFCRIKTGGEEKIIIENELVCVGTAGMSFSDYQRARTVGLLIAIFYNNSFSHEDFEVFKSLGLTPFDYLLALIDLPKPPSLERAIENFKRHLSEELFDSLDELELFVSHPDTYDKLLNNEIGVSLIYKYSQEAQKEPNELYEFAKLAAQRVGGQALSSHLELSAFRKFLHSKQVALQPH